MDDPKQGPGKLLADEPARFLGEGCAFRPSAEPLPESAGGY